jgi:hypothetical protein
MIVISEKFTSETIKARQFQSTQKYFFVKSNDLAFIVSDLHFGNSLLKNRRMDIWRGTGG